MGFITKLSTRVSGFRPHEPFNVVQDSKKIKGKMGKGRKGKIGSAVTFVTEFLGG